MKQLKYFAMAALMAAFSACSEDNEALNSGAATVEFESSSLSFNENFGVVEVPLAITGELNGPIKVTFSVEGLQGAVENEHYVVTTNTITIPASLDGTFACELHLLDDGITENDDRAVRVNLENVEGATVGANSSCMVTIADVDKLPYYKLLGNYTFTALDLTAGGAEVSYNVTLSDGDTQEEKLANAEIRYVVKGFTGEFSSLGYSSEEVWTIEYNKSAQSLSLVPGDMYNDVAPINFGFDGDVAVIPMVPAYTAAGELTFDMGDYVDASWNETYDVITFDPYGYMGIGVFDHASSLYAGYYQVFGNVIMTKKAE